MWKTIKYPSKTSKRLELKSTNEKAMRHILGINYYFSDSEREDAVFSKRLDDRGSNVFSRNLKAWMEKNYDVEVHTWDCIDWNSPEVLGVLYFDYSWRYALQDKILSKIPFHKRALMMIEPANVNPSLYYIPFLRNRFRTIFTWDENLLQRHRNYKPVNVPVGAEPSSYQEDRFAHIAFHDKKLLVAVSRNRWSYMPQSTYRQRATTYRHFSAAQPDQFDLFGQGWSRTDCPAYRGEIKGGWDAKVSTIARYKFAICFENNISQPGYISEKILDCFCARCVPVYYGSAGVEKHIPKDCYIDFRDFRNLQELEEFIVSMPEHRHAQYIHAINRFLMSPAAEFFSTKHYLTTLAEGLNLPKRENALTPSS